MKKSLLVLLLLAVAVTALAACTGGNDPVEPTQAATTTAPQQETTTAATTTGDDTPAPAPADGAWQPFPADWEPFDERFIAFNEAFPPVDLGGLTLRINLGDPEDIEDEFDREEMIARRDWVQQAFNITLDFVAEDLNAIDWGERPDQIIASVAAGDPIVHIFNAANAATWFPQLARAGVLVPDSQNFIRNNFPPNWYTFAGEFQGTIYGMDSLFPFAANMGLFYNRELIQRIGMDRTPSEMFVAGEWSFDDFYTYMSELSNLMPGGAYPFAAHPDHFLRGLTFANGGYIKNPSTGAPGYLEESFLEAGRLIQRLMHSGLAQGPGFDAEANEGEGAWSFGPAFFPAPVGQFNEGDIAMTILQRWQIPGSSAHVEFGFVPFPWGPDVTFPGNWQDLRNAGYNSFMLDANLLLLIEGSPGIDTGVLNHEIAARILYSYLLNDLAKDSMLAHRAGQTAEIPAPNVNDLFEQIDRDLWQWYASGPVLEVTTRMGTPTTFWSAFHSALANNTDLRPGFEAILGEDVWAMYQLGNIRLEDMPEAVRIQAVEFGAMPVATDDNDED